MKAEQFPLRPVEGLDIPLGVKVYEIDADHLIGALCRICPAVIGLYAQEGVTAGKLEADAVSHMLEREHMQNVASQRLGLSVSSQEITGQDIQ